MRGADCRRECAGLPRCGRRPPSDLSRSELISRSRRRPIIRQGSHKSSGAAHSVGEVFHPCAIYLGSRATFAVRLHDLTYAGKVRGFGPPVAQSSSSTVCTTGSVVPLAI
jgi:hypothetical protein